VAQLTFNIGPKNCIARPADRDASGSQSGLPGGVSVAEAFGVNTSPLDLHQTEKKLIAQALAATNGNVTAATKKLGISRRTLHRKINETNLAKAAPSGYS
jgi:transcriptional regulator of acetoin/glycerol metabolism